MNTTISASYVGKCQRDFCPKFIRDDPSMEIDSCEHGSMIFGNRRESAEKATCIYEELSLTSVAETTQNWSIGMSLFAFLGSQRYQFPLVFPTKSLPTGVSGIGVGN